VLFEETGARLHAARRELAELRRLLEADARRAAQITTDLQDAVRQTRMLPVSTLFEPLPRMVRDLARDSGKEVTLSISGGDTEVDRSVLERIKDPLTHLLRNAVDHGVEAPELRAEARKPEGTISLSAEHRGDMLVIERTSRRRQEGAPPIRGRRGAVGPRGDRPDLPLRIFDQSADH
jgi:two-component system chemotaxis sensor kinase CheA